MQGRHFQWHGTLCIPHACTSPMMESPSLPASSHRLRPCFGLTFLDCLKKNIEKRKIHGLYREISATSEVEWFQGAKKMRPARHPTRLGWCDSLALQDARAIYGISRVHFNPWRKLQKDGNRKLPLGMGQNLWNYHIWRNQHPSAIYKSTVLLPGVMELPTFPYLSGAS